jgi:hypothetical protein
MKQIGNIAGAVIGLAIVAVIAARPAFIDSTFKGATGLIGVAVSPVTTKPK